MSEEKKQKSDEIKEFGALMLNENKKNYKIRLLTIIGEIEGHETVSNNTKATKYEHLLPQLAEAEESDEVEGVLILLNTLGGDVEAGLAIAEMIASLGKPTVSLVLGGSHSIGGPLAVSADYSFIVPTGTMVVHPVRSNGTFIGVTQSLRNMERTQDRIARFIAAHSKITEKRLVDLMLNPTQLKTAFLRIPLLHLEKTKQEMIKSLCVFSQAFVCFGYGLPIRMQSQVT